MLIKNLSERSLRLEPVDKAVEKAADDSSTATASTKPADTKPLDASSKVTNKHFSPLLRQVIASSGPILATTAAGMTSGYSAVLLPQLQFNDSAIVISSDEASWIASMAALPMALGCILGGILMERYGRRTTQLVLNVPFTIGWALIFAATTLEIILAGRFLTGISVGMLGAPAAVYIGEMSGPRYRGFLLAAQALAIALGILIAHTLGTFLPWNICAALCGILPLSSFVLLWFVPESPSWLLSRGRIEEAAVAFRWLRGGSAEAASEFESMVLAKTAAAGSDGSVSAYSLQGLRQNIGRAAFVRPLFILVGFFAMMQFAGVNAIAFYSVEIMRLTIGPGVNEYLAMLVIDGVRFAMSLLACVLLRTCGRRPLACVSGFGTAGSLIGLSAFLYANQMGGVKDDLLERYAWLPMLLLIAFICFVSIGVVPLPWCMTGELFPLALRGLGSGVVSCVNFMCFFLVVKTGPLLFSRGGAEGAFMLYGLVALVGTIGLLLWLPETKNRTLQEIEESFEGDKMEKKTKKQADNVGTPAAAAAAAVA